MSTHDLVISNQDGASFRSDVNGGLQALGSQQAGTADPPAMYSYEKQARTDMGVIRRRNAANTAWVLADTLAEIYAVSRSSDTILALADFKKFFKFTGTFTQTLTAAATLGDGWYCYCRNDGTGITTLNPNGSETIDGVATIDLLAGDSCLLLCDGTNFKTFGLNQSLSKYVTFTRDNTLADGTQAITGVGFKPTSVIFFGNNNNGDNLTLGFVDSALGGGSVFVNPGIGYTFDTSTEIVYYDGTNVNRGVVTAIGSDGFTITWTKQNTPTGTSTYIALCMR